MSWFLVRGDGTSYLLGEEGADYLLRNRELATC